MDITLENKESQAVDSSYRAFDFPVPATSFPAETGTIDFGGGKTASYALGNQTGPKSRWCHIQGLSWDLAANEKITGTLNTPGTPTLQTFATTTTGIDRIGGASSSGAKPTFEVVYSDSTPTLTLTLDYWEQTNSSVYLHEWTARGRDVDTGILGEMTFMFWPHLANQVELGGFLVKSDVTKNIGHVANVAYVDVVMPSGWKGYYWWDEFIVRGPSTTSRVRVWTNMETSGRWSEGVGSPGFLMTMLSDSAGADERNDIISRAKRGMDAWGIATRTDWAGKFGPIPGFIEDYGVNNGGKESQAYGYNIQTAEQFIAARRGIYDGQLNSIKQLGGGQSQLYWTWLATNGKAHRTGDHPGISQHKSYAPFCVASGNPQYVSEIVFNCLPYFRRQVWFRQPGPGDAGYGSNNGEPIEFADYRWASRPSDPKSSNLAVSGEFPWYAAIYNSAPWTDFPFKQAQMYQAGFRERQVGGDQYEKGRESHWLMQEYANAYLLTGRRIFGILCEQHIRSWLFEWHNGDYLAVKATHAGFNGGTLSGRSGRSYTTLAWLLHCTTDTTLTGVAKTRITERFDKAPASGYQSEFEELWRRKALNYPFRINETTSESKLPLPAWTAWYMPLAIPGYYMAYLETSDAEVLELIQEMGRTWLDDGFYFIQLPYQNAAQWNAVKYIVTPGYGSNEGNDGDRPYRNHPTFGNYYERYSGPNARVEYLAGISTDWLIGALKCLEKVFTDSSEATYAAKAKELHDYYYAIGPDLNAEQGHFAKFENQQINAFATTGPNPQPITFTTTGFTQTSYGADNTRLYVASNNNQGPNPSSRISFRIRNGRRRTMFGRRS